MVKDLSGFAAPQGPGASGGSSSEPAGAAAAAGGSLDDAPPAPAAAKQQSKPAAAASARAAPPTKQRKKRAPKKGGGAAAASAENDSLPLDEETEVKPLADVGPAFQPMSLPQIQLRLKNLLEKLPTDLPDTPPAYDATTTGESTDAHYAPVKSFAEALQTTIEEYNLLLSLVSAATYQWGVDRSGASQQNLSVMSAELQQCQDVISSVVSSRLSNVLCPAVDVLIGEVEIQRGEGSNASHSGGGEEQTETKTPAKKRKLNDDRLAAAPAGGNERRINHYARPLVDPSYVHLCHCILARNAAMIRHAVATSVHAAQKVIGDYLKAMKKDSSHEAGKGGYY
ncbi:hypothetical protein ACHAXT_012541 [Thalassiosira profunda]